MTFDYLDLICLVSGFLLGLATVFIAIRQAISHLKQEALKHVLSMVRPKAGSVWSRYRNNPAKDEATAEVIAYYAREYNFKLTGEDVEKLADLQQEMRDGLKAAVSELRMLIPTGGGPVKKVLFRVIENAVIPYIENNDDWVEAPSVRLRGVSTASTL